MVSLQEVLALALRGNLIYLSLFNVNLCSFYDDGKIEDCKECHYSCEACKSILPFQIIKIIALLFIDGNLPN